MKIKILVVVLIFLIVVNLATIGTYIFLRLTGGARETVQRLHLGPGLRGLPPDHADHLPGAEGPPHVRLAPEEQEQLRHLLDAFRDETWDLKERIHELENETLELMKMDPVRRDAVDSLLQEISFTQLEISRIAAGKMIDAKKFLTEEQSRLFYDAILRARPSRPGALPLPRSELREPPAGMPLPPRR